MGEDEDAKCTHLVRLILLTYFIIKFIFTIIYFHCTF